MDRANPIGIEPLYDRILVKRIEAEERTKGGLYIPDNAKEKQLEGIVIEVGEGRFVPATGGMADLRIRPGDRVLFGKYSGTEVEHQGQEYLLIAEQEILARINREFDEDARVLTENEEE